MKFCQAKVVMGSHPWSEVTRRRWAVPYQRLENTS